MDIKKFKFTAPRDIKSGEVFSFEELFGSNENMDALIEVNKMLIEDEAEKLLSKREQELQERYKSKEDDLREYFERMKNDLQEQANEKVNNAVSIAKSEVQSQLEVAQAKVEMLTKTTEEKKEIIDSLKETYEEILEQKLDKIRADHSKEKEELIKEYEDKAKSASTIGEDAEETIRSTLRSLFPNDSIEKPNHALGEADVLHTIINNGKDVARVYYEVKNRKNWSNADYENFATKVRKEDHEFNIYIAQALPKQSKSQHLIQFNEGMFYDEVNNIYLTSFENWLPVIAVIRKQAIVLKQVQANSESMNDIKDRVYAFFKSPEFNNYFMRLKKNFEEIETVFKTIQKATVDGKAIKEKATLEVLNLEAEINSKLNA